MEELVALLQEKQLTISSCESLTGGLFSSSIAAIPGASNVLMGGIVVYQNEIKVQVAHVDAQIIECYGAISKECAQAMAQQTRLLLHCDICVSFTGNAGPGVMEEKPSGLVYCAIANETHIQCFEFLIEGNRNMVRHVVVNKMCEEVKRFVR